MDYPYRDVWHKSELPDARPGFRYLDFLGGTKNLRCWEVPSDLPRIQFIDEADGLLDECHDPIFHHGGISVRQDSSYALPGFYVVALNKTYRALDDIPMDLHFAVSLVISTVRRGMRDVIDREFIHMHYEEKASASCNVHYWLMPVTAKDKDGAPPPIMRLALRDYLNGFRYDEQRQDILDCNNRMKDFLARTGLADLVDGTRGIHRGRGTSGN